MNTPATKPDLDSPWQNLIAMFLLLLLMSINTTLHAEPKIESSLRHYSITGKTPSEIRRSLEKQGPTGQDGDNYHASTRWNVQWGFRWIESGRRCQMHHPEVQLRIDMLMPELDKSIRLQGVHQQQWQNYYSALLRHEQQHADIATRAARELERELADLIDWHPCHLLEDRINERAQSVLDKYLALERELDRRTDHGAKDGVMLPWSKAPVAPD